MGGRSKSKESSLDALARALAAMEDVVNDLHTLVAEWAKGDQRARKQLEELLNEVKQSETK